jgi:hypothetical protein
MNCESFHVAVEDLERPGALDEATSEALLTHAESCLSCARRLHETRVLTRALRSLGRADEWKSASPALETRLRRAFRSQAGWRVRHQPARWWMWAAAAAALILALGAGIAWRRFKASAPQGATSRAAVNIPPARPAEPPAESKSSTPTKPSHLKRNSERPVRHSKRGPVVYARVQPQELDDFLPLPYADPEAPLGSGEVVRIQVSASSLALLGISINDVGSSQPVVADVALGEDGVARAIRFVSGPVVEAGDD